MSPPTPRAFIIRHGETSWSLSGRHTGNTDIPLTTNGERRVRATGLALVGPDRLIVPQKVRHVYVSPRFRARRTLELLALVPREALPWSTTKTTSRNEQEDRDTKETETKGDAPATAAAAATTTTIKHRCDARISITEDIREWDYGDYEGLTSKEIHEQRVARGEKVPWDIWRDGCPGGEGPEQVSRRLDAVIEEMRGRYHRGLLEGKEGAEKEEGDVVVVAHGHILRAFAMRWIGRELDEGVSLLLEGQLSVFVLFLSLFLNPPLCLAYGLFRG